MEIILLTIHVWKLKNNVWFMTKVRTLATLVVWGSNVYLIRSRNKDGKDIPIFTGEQGREYINRFIYVGE